MSKKQPIAYVICGFIGAGKTTFARKLEKETGAIRVVFSFNKHQFQHLL